MSVGLSFLTFTSTLIIATTGFAQTNAGDPIIPDKNAEIVQDIKGAVKVDRKKSKTIRLNGPVPVTTPIPSPSPSPTPSPTPEPSPTPSATPIAGEPNDEPNDPESLAPAAYAAESHRFGFHGTAGLPHLMTFGLDYIHKSGFFGAGVNFGGFSSKTSDIEIGLSHTEIALQYYPFAGSFFVGAMIGQQSIKGKKAEVNQPSGQTLIAEVDVKTNYITPHVGWNWIWDSGFNLGFEVGYQAPTSNSTELKTNADTFGITEANNADYAAQVKEVKDKGDQLGKIGLPYITLIKIGWLF